MTPNEFIEELDNMSAEANSSVDKLIKDIELRYPGIVSGYCVFKHATKGYIIGKAIDLSRMDEFLSAQD